MKELAASYQFSTTVKVVNTDIETASWYSDLIVGHPHHQWLAGAFVEADRQNRNGQYFPLEHLRAAYKGIVNSPMKPLRPGSPIEENMMIAKTTA